MIPVFKPRLPIYDDLEPYLREMDASNMYSNFGPLSSSLGRLLAEKYGINLENICLLNSGTSGLLACLSIIMESIPKDKAEITIGVPAWSFIATAQVPAFLGAQIVFIDVNSAGFVDPSSDHSLDILIVTSPFGEVVDIDYWKIYAEKSGTKLVFDCAAAFDTVKPSEFPTVVSTHATKGFSTGEGGFVISNDSDFIAKIRSFANFGLNTSRTSHDIGLNLKMSEINCAYGLAALNNKQKYLQPYQEQIAEYDHILSSSDLRIKIFNSQFTRTTYNILIPACEIMRDDVILSLLINYGIEARNWWGKPLFQYPQFTTGGIVNSTFPAASDLSSRILGLPVGCHLNFEMQEYIVRSILRIFDQ